MAAWSKLFRVLRLAFLRIIQKRLATRNFVPDDLRAVKIEAILFLCLQERLSELLICTPTFKAVRRAYPAAVVTVLARSNFTTVLAGSKDIDEIIGCAAAWRQGSFAKLADLFKKLRSGFDLVIVLDDRTAFTAGAMARMTGTQFILGSEKPTLDGFEENFFFTMFAPYSSHNRHQTQRCIDIVRYIGVKASGMTEVVLISGKEKVEAVRFLNENGVEVQDVILAICVAPATGENPWDTHKFVSVANHFGTRLGVQIVLFKEESDDVLSQSFLEGLPFKPVEAAGLNLRGKAALLSCCNLLITSDIEMMHLTAAVGTAVVGLWGKSDPAFWKPQGKNLVHIKGNTETCANIVATRVTAAAEKLLKKYPKRLSDLPDNFDISEQAVNDVLSFGDITEDY